MINTIKPFEELDFTDDYMFYRVLQDNDICKEVLENLLKVKIERIERQELQKELKPYYTSKGILLDAYIKDSGLIYNIEMQQVSKTELPKRTRYYQSMIDSASLLKGTDYDKLNESFILFICKQDPFDKKLSVYSFENICNEDKSLRLKDATHKIFFNAEAADKEKDLAIKAFLNYIKNRKSSDSLTDRIEQIVRQIKTAESDKEYYMFESLRVRDHIMEGIAIGVQQGAQQKTIEDARSFYANGASVELIAKSLNMTEDEVKQIVSESVTV